MSHKAALYNISSGSALVLKKQFTGTEIHHYIEKYKMDNFILMKRVRASRDFPMSDLEQNISPFPIQK